MDEELLDELRAIVDGDITDPRRCRRAFVSAAEVLDEKLDELYRQQDLLKAARTAFLDGWPSRQLRAC